MSEATSTNGAAGNGEHRPARRKLTVVLSQAQGKNPTKRALEESIAAALILEPGLDVSIVPYLYDLDGEHTGRLFLESITGDMVVLAWMYPRAAFWLLDRDGIKGQYGENLISARPDADEDEEAEEPPPAKGIGAVNVPDRHVYCLDLRDHSDFQVYVDEVKRIAAECKARHEEGLKKWINGTPNLVQLGRYLREEPKPEASFTQEEILKQPGRRWYPVIDYSRCTNCMECLDFCLFGVYGVDSLDRILVENQDNCKKGCPACSRVCPEHAIMFPDYKTAAIAGAPVGAVSGLKIDLTKLFGGGDALSMAAQERDVELVKDGRQAVGLTVGIPKRQAEKPQEPKDDLDKLMDALDDLEI
jgi:NAD-dependent dihydropyrimidine dehydrogenase PreA subunit